MKLKSIELNNIGPYVGKNNFSFSSDYKRNTILFGGRNGSGKTTFLESFRIGLYGSLAYGFRTTSDTYLKKVSSLLNDDVKYEEKHSIKVVFYLADQFEENKYTIERWWEYKEKEVIENVKVFRDDVLLSPVERDDFFELLKSNFAPSLLKLCFFDGEKILRLEQEEEIAFYLKSLIHNLFDIDLYESLEQSLQEYLYTSVDSAELEELINNVKTLSTELKLKEKKIKSLENEIEENNRQIKDLKLINKKLEDEFLRHGGLYYEQQKQIERKILEIEHSRKENLDFIKKFIGNELPFFLAYPIYKQLVSQLEKEREHNVSQLVRDKIDELSMNNLFNKLNLPQKDTEIEQAFKKDLIEMLTSDDSVKMIHNLSTSESDKLISIFERLNKDYLIKIKEKIQEVNEQLKYLRQLRQTLEKQEDTIEFKDLLKEMNLNNNKIFELENKAITLSERLTSTKIEYEEIEKKHRIEEQKLSNGLREKGSLLEAEKAVNVVRKFKEKQLWNKIKDVEHLSLTMVNRLFRKSDYITSIKINPKTFKVSLYDNDQNKINKNLSAGENHLVVLSIFWATIKASKKQVPIILDTLLGRLDSIHSETVINHLIPEFGNQVIILATDTEINEELYLNLKPVVSREYTLEYITKQKRTQVKEGFFNFSKGVTQIDEFSFADNNRG